MIKSFNSFNESKTEAFYFAESEECESLLSKYKLSDNVIHEYFVELLDEGFETSTDYKISSSENGRFEINLTITFSKDYLNPIGRKKLIKRSGVDVYLSFLQDQVNCIQLSTQLSSRFEKAEEYESVIKGSDIQYVPFIGAGNNMKEYDELSYTLCFKKIINTNEYEVAKNKFEHNNNPGRKALSDIIHELVLAGIPKKNAQSLISLHPEYEEMDEIIFGFSTNDEIRDIARYDKKTKKLRINGEEVAKALQDYENGYCSDYI